jgi:secreted PhoX family phosphatase
LAWPAAPGTPSGGAAASRALGFKPVAASGVDRVVVPEGYVAAVLAPWGEPVGIAGRHAGLQARRQQQRRRAGRADGHAPRRLQYYALDGSRRGLLAINQEYTDDGLLHPDGQKTWTPEKVRKAQAAHGITVIEIEQQASGWQMVRPSRYARRITASTPFAIGGPAAGHTLMKTAADPAGRTVLGTIGNCASGKTPWGTYLSAKRTGPTTSPPPTRPPGTNAAGASARPPGTAGPNTTNASTPCATPTNPTALAGSSRSTRWTPPARPSSAPRWAAPRTKAPGWR